MLTLTSPVRTWAHPLPAGLKLGALALASVVLFRLQGPVAQAAAFAGGLALMASGKRVFFRQAVAALWVLWPFVVIVGLWHLATGAPGAGAAVVLRMLSCFALANFVTMTTRFSDMLALAERLCRPLAGLGLSPRRLALAAALVIRFVPVLMRRADEIGAAFRARSPRRPGWRVAVPLTLAALDEADHAAEALRARGGAG